MRKKLVSVVLSVGLILSMCPAASARALADELDPEEPVVIEQQEEEQEEPAEEQQEEPVEEKVEEIVETPAEEPVEELAEIPEEEEKVDPVEETPVEEMIESAETPEEEEKIEPAEEPVEEVAEEAENLEEEAFNENEVDGVGEAETLPKPEYYEIYFNKTSGHVIAEWYYDDDFMEEIEELEEAPKIDAVITVYKDGTAIGEFYQDIIEDDTWLNLTKEGLIPMDSTSEYYFTVQLKPRSDETRYLESKKGKSQKVIPAEITRRSLEASVIPVVDGDDEVLVSVKGTGLYGEASTIYGNMYFNGEELDYDWWEPNSLDADGIMSFYYDDDCFAAGDEIEINLWLSDTYDGTRYLENEMTVTVLGVEDITVTFDTQGIGSLEEDEIVLTTGDIIGDDGIEEPAQSGYIFRGWSREQKGVGEYIYDEDTFDLEERLYEDTTLYAMWDKVFNPVVNIEAPVCGSTVSWLSEGDSFEYGDYDEDEYEDAFDWIFTGIKKNFSSVPVVTTNAGLRWTGYWVTSEFNEEEEEGQEDQAPKRIYEGEFVGGKKYIAEIMLMYIGEEGSEGNPYSFDETSTVSGNCDSYKIIDAGSSEKYSMIIIEATITAVHDWSEWKILEESTTEKAGKAYRECQSENCNVRETVDLDKIPVSYSSVKETADITYVKGTGKPARFVFKRNEFDEKTSSLFKGIIKMNGVEISPGMYSTGKGSLIVDFKPEFLDKLADGKYEIEVYFEDGVASAVLHIVTEKASTPEKEESKVVIEDKKTDTKKTTDKTVKTGDETAVDMMFIMCLAGLAGVTLTMILKKKREE